MKLGIFSYNTDYGIRPDVLAVALEARGYESLWVGEHTHIPASRETPYPGGDRVDAHTELFTELSGVHGRDLVRFVGCRDVLVAVGENDDDARRRGLTAQHLRRPRRGAKRAGPRHV